MALQALLAMKNDYPVVKLAAVFLAGEIQRISGKRPEIRSSTMALVTVIAGSIGKCKLIDKLITTGKLKDVDKIKGKWEASLW